VLPNGVEGNVGGLVDHLFRREAGKMVSALTRILGTENLETAEDVVQETLLRAMEVWPYQGVPEQPSAWLFSVARNKAIDVLRRTRRVVHVDFDNESVPDSRGSGGMDAEGDMLRMMFACCSPGISEASQIAIILKTLCGFGTAEIARAFVIPEETVSKRLFRAREFFRQEPVRLEIPVGEEARRRIDAVLNAIYLLFNEGCNSTSSEELIRGDLIEEAMRLCGLLAENPNTQRPEVFALMALMCFHSSRMESRLTTEGEIILLPDQDRSRWSRGLIAEGNAYMNRAAFGDSLTRYHLEAAIAYEHCAAGSFSTTDWERILQLYGLLREISPSPFVELNMAVAILCARGPAAAAEALQGIEDKRKLESYHLYHSLLGEIDLRMNRGAQAAHHFAAARDMTKSEPERRLLTMKIAAAAAQALPETRKM